MTNMFCLIIDEKDGERFRVFNSQSNKKDGLLFWGAPNIKKNIWNVLSKNDWIFFTLQNSDHVVKGKLVKKEINKNLALKLWKDTPRNRLIDHFLYFQKVEDEPVSFYQMMKRIGLHRSTKIFPGLYEFKPVPPSFEPDGKTELEVPIPVDYDAAPTTKTLEVTRFIRDTTKTKKLKGKYQNRCQVCGYRIRIRKNKFYSEVHHLHPLKDGGDDNYNNMLVLCPTHHAEFDYKVIGIDRDGVTIIDRNGKSDKRLTVMRDHKIHEKNITFHLHGMNLK